MARPKKKPAEAVKLDATVLDIGGLYPETMVTIRENLEHGNPATIRRELDIMSTQIENMHEVFKRGHVAMSRTAAHWLAEALLNIARGMDANKALGLKRRWSMSPAGIKNLAYMVNDLHRQGLSKADALSFVSRYNHSMRKFSKDDGGDALGKRLERGLNRLSRQKAR